MWTSEQLRAARAALRMEQATLAEKAEVSVETIKRLEGMDGKLRAQHVTLHRIRTVLEQHGVEFIEQEGATGCVFFKDRSAFLRREISNHITGLINSSLEVQLRSNPDLFDQGSDVVIAAIEKLLPGLLRHTIPNTLRGFVK